MPTPTGLPKAGEVWERRFRLPPDWQLQTGRVTILERSGGSYWSVRVRLHKPEEHQPPVQLWVDASYWHSKGEFVYVGKEQ
jgi:hypothetical protein